LGFGEPIGVVGRRVESVRNRELGDVRNVGSVMAGEGVDR